MSDPYATGPYARIAPAVRYLAYHIGVRPTEVTLISRMRDLPGGVVLMEAVYGRLYELVPVPGEGYWYRQWGPALHGADTHA